MAQEDVTTSTFEVGREDIATHRQIKDPLIEEKERIKQEAGKRGKEILSEQKGKASHFVEDFAEALRRSARQLEEQSHPASARYLDKTAEGLASFSQTLNSRDIDTIMREVRDFAVKQPAVLVAGSLLAGFFLARLLKSGYSETQKQETGTAEGWPTTHH